MMKAKSDPIQYAIPHSTTAFHLSRTALGLLSATIILAILLSYSTYQNINRAQTVIERFLLDKGETIIRSLEAGIRTSTIMMHHMDGADPLHTLLAESGKEKDIIFIVIYNEDGSVFDQTGSVPQSVIDNSVTGSLLYTDGNIKEVDQRAGIFTLTKTISMSKRVLKLHQLSEGNYNDRDQADKLENRKLISVGLLTEEFDIARKQDARHTLFMGAILFLVGTTALYFLFLYQKMRLTSATLADMKLYTDSIIESIPVSLITLDAKNNIVSCNKNTLEIFGCPLKQLISQNIDDALPDCSKTILKACASQYEQSIECITRDSKNIPLHISCSPLVNHDSENIGKVLIIRDMSSIKHMELQLERSRRMAALGKMAAGIAHEIRNPLSTLRGFAQFFAHQPGGEEEREQYSALMVSEIDRLNHTVSGLLQFSRPREPQFQHFPLGELVKKTVMLLEVDLTDRTMHTEIPDNQTLELYADPDLLLQVIMNLLKNSINATGVGSTISIICSEDNELTRITIIDNGCGMTTNEREKMFDPFFTTTKMGTGLGLAVSHQIIEQHHGSFTVKTKKNKGTTIIISLPKMS